MHIEIDWEIYSEMVGEEREIVSHQYYLSNTLETHECYYYNI